ncbi:hypothetical protein AUF17_17255 [Enterococcus avium]|uniref:Ascorbate-specific PTS system EIIA component n=1 Tax=Enterococcus avium TaxID=33945 RepID=A0A8B5VZ50_ENTAV|nr:BglG family transcription antiterminator [Enterococcus avium]TRZ29396.1 hypothetical protein AUF17_17255 [Enterococcus avium]
MDKRSERILNYLVYHSQVDSRTLMKEFHITRNQLNYSIKKINGWCEGLNFPEVMRTRNGLFYLSPELLAHFKQAKGTEAAANSFYTENDRCNIILLILFSKPSYLSLDHFMIDLQISKNTVLRSLRYLKRHLPNEIELTYSRSHGYDLAGNEWNLRKLLIETVSSLRKLSNGDQLLMKFAEPVSDKIAIFHEILEDAEETLKVKFSDEQVEILPYILAIINYRIANGKVIQESFQINNSMLADTKEYAVASEMFDNWKEIPDQEKLFITLQLLTTNIISGDILTEELSKNLSSIIEDCLTTFEKKACVTLKDKQDLKERMILHMKPAFYRMRYHLNLKMKIEDIQFDPKYDAFKELIREAFQPLQEFIGESIPDEEFLFITLFILSALSEEQKERESYHAVVVCKSGILISQTLNTFLQKIFPEFTFLPPCSLRDFSKIKSKIDVVFSTVHDRTALEKKLIELFQTRDDYPYDQEINHEISLLDVLTLDAVQIIEQVEDYQEAIRLGSRPLLKKGQITSNYIQSMIESHNMDDSYIVLGNEVAIPHSRPEEGVNELAVSLLHVRQGVNFSRSERVHFVFIIAPINQESHINALFEIMSIAEDEHRLRYMRTCSTPQELLNSLKLGEGEEDK